MRIYCMSDIHGCMAEFVDALALVWDHLDEPDTMLCLLGTIFMEAQMVMQSWIR